jgi:hypothetical protein
MIPMTGLRTPQRTIKRAYDLERGNTVSSDALIEASPEQYNEIRRAATEARLLGMARFVCEKCGYAVYAPREPRTRLPFWQHYRGAPHSCEWWSGESGTVDNASGSQFHGQQESPLHFKLKEIIAELLRTDAGVRPETTIVDKYLEGVECKRKPDVRCEFGERPLAFELQLSSTQLPIIVGRENFYKENSRFLLWITWQFETVPFQRVRTAFQDIFFSHNQNIFSIDDETIQQSRVQLKFLFRSYWLEKDCWQQKIVALEELHWPHSGLPFFREPMPPWHRNFRKRWCEGSNPEGVRWQDQEKLLIELSNKLGLGFVSHYEFVEQQIVLVLDFLISVEHGHPTASKQTNLAQLVNTFLAAETRFRFANLAMHVLKRANPGILERESVKTKLKNARQHRQDDRSSLIGKIAVSLFPEWFDS